jgi:hypothetical protein
MNKHVLSWGHEFWLTFPVISFVQNDICVEIKDQNSVNSFFFLSGNCIKYQGSSIKGKVSYQISCGAFWISFWRGSSRIFLPRLCLCILVTERG